MPAIEKTTSKPLILILEEILITCKSNILMIMFHIAYRNNTNNLETIKKHYEQYFPGVGGFNENNENYEHKASEEHLRNFDEIIKFNPKLFEKATKYLQRKNINELAKTEPSAAPHQVPGSFFDSDSGYTTSESCSRSSSPASQCTLSDSDGCNSDDWDSDSDDSQDCNP